MVKELHGDDLEIAFERHATSKIRSADDLNTVTSMGFRGEALASIAAVANVELVSKTEEQETGYKIIVEAGDVLDKEETGCSTGTTITVRNLFFNTPVRYKFLRKDYTESGYIEDVITRVALVNPNVAIKLINTGKTVIQTNGSGKLKDVIYSIYGKDIANGTMDVDYTYEDIKVNGVIGKPEIARSNRSNQLFFVNKRYIKDKTLTSATEQAYKGLITIGKFGFVVLNLTIDPSKVDVNVHPAKLEVRFQEENKVFQAVYHAIKDVLLKSELVKDPIKSDDNFNKINRTPNGFDERLNNLRESKKDNSTNGLFGFRKQHEKEIEKYNDQESKIKTNNIIEDIYNQNKSQNGNLSNLTIGDISKENKNDKKFDTSDVLKQLRKMKQKLENEIKDNGVLTLKEESDLNKQENEQDNKEGNLSEIKKLNEKTKTLQPEKDADKQSEKLQSENQSDEEIESKNIFIEESEKLQSQNNSNEKIEKIDKALNDIGDQEVKQEFSEIKEKINQLDNNTDVVSDDFDEMYTKLFGRPPISDNTETDNNILNNDASDLINNNISIFKEGEKVEKPQYKLIGIIFRTYIILQVKDEMYMVDQHAAHERILYEKVKKNYYSNNKRDTQLLLLPDVITLTHKEMDVAKENMDIFQKAGFMLEEFGENTIKLTGVPTICVDLDTKDLFLETLDQINTVARTAKQEKEEKFLATVACKAAVKANMDLAPEEVEKLIDGLLSLPNPFTCPHGRPTIIKMTKYDIERKFSRK